MARASVHPHSARTGPAPPATSIDTRRRLHVAQLAPVVVTVGLRTRGRSRGRCRSRLASCAGPERLALQVGVAARRQVVLEDGPGCTLDLEEERVLFCLAPSGARCRPGCPRCPRRPPCAPHRRSRTLRSDGGHRGAWTGSRLNRFRILDCTSSAEMPMISPSRRAGTTEGGWLDDPVVAVHVFGQLRERVETVPGARLPSTLLGRLPRFPHHLLGGLVLLALGRPIGSVFSSSSERRAYQTSSVGISANPAIASRYARTAARVESRASDSVNPLFLAAIVKSSPTA